VQCSDSGHHRSDLRDTRSKAGDLPSDMFFKLRQRHQPSFQPQLLCGGLLQPPVESGARSTKVRRPGGNQSEIRSNATALPGFLFAPSHRRIPEQPSRCSVGGCEALTLQSLCRKSRGVTLALLIARTHTLRNLGSP
jgi:hypothetical protein